MANDSTVKAGSWGKRTVEKIIRIQETAREAARARSSTWSTRRARASPIRSRCSPGAAARGASSTTRCSSRGRVPADLSALRPVGGGRRVHPGVLRRGGDGRRQRQHVPRLAAHGRDGHRREGDARGDGRRQDALLGVGLRRRARQDRGRGDRVCAQVLPRVHAAELRERRRRRRPRPRRRRSRSRSRRSSRPTRTRRST